MKRYQGEKIFSNRALVRLIIPLIIEQFLTFLIGIVDSVMVSSVGEAAVSGVSLVDSVNALINGIFTALATGGAVIIGQYVGRSDKERSCKSAEQLYLLVTLCSVFVMAVVYILRNFILTVVFGKIEPDVYKNANIYLLIVTASIPFIAIYNSGAAIFRIMGNSKISMLASGGMNIINVILNAIMIYGLKMGVAGAATATLISRISAAVFITVLLRNPKLLVHFPKDFSFRVDFSYAKNIMRIGIPNGIENSIFHFGKLLILNLITTFGTSAITANAISSTIANLQILPGYSISFALLTVVSRCVGQNDYPQAKYYVRKLMFLSQGIMLVYNFLFVLLTPTILSLYHLTEETYGITYRIVLLHGITSIFIWSLSYVLPNALRAAGDVKYTMTVSVLSMCGLRIGLAYFIGSYLGYGVFGTWVAMMIDWSVRMLMFGGRYISGKWKNKKVI